MHRLHGLYHHLGWPSIATRIDSGPDDALAGPIHVGEHDDGGHNEQHDDIRVGALVGATDRQGRSGRTCVWELCLEKSPLC